MSNSTIKSNLVGQAGTETISNFASISVGAVTSSGAISGTTITGTGAVSGTNITGSGKVKAGTYFQIGTHQYIFVDSSATPAVILANATAIDASVANSLVLGNKQLHFIVSNASINTVTATALHA